MSAGSLEGGCVILERIISRTLLLLAFNHHIFDLVLKPVFEGQVSLLSGSDVTIFRRFRDSWPTTKQTKFILGM